METIKTLLIDETISLFTSATDVARSGAYIYPFKGIYHLTTHSSLHRPIRLKIPTTITLGLGVTTSMFFFTYLPQTAIMSLTSGPLLAPITTAFLVLSESSAITNYLARKFVIGDALVDVFDGVLVGCGFEGLVKRGRKVHRDDGSRDPVKRLGEVKKEDDTNEKREKEKRERGKITGLGQGIDMRAILKQVALMPLNFVPVIGTVLYVFVQGKKVGPGLLERYFELRGLSRADAITEVERRRGEYTGLGMAAVVLEMIPFASIAFSFSNAVGAALWVADLEKQ